MKELTLSNLILSTSFQMLAISPFKWLYFLHLYKHPKCHPNSAKMVFRKKITTREKTPASPPVEMLTNFSFGFKLQAFPFVRFFIYISQDSPLPKSWLQACFSHGVLEKAGLLAHRDHTHPFGFW